MNQSFFKEDPGAGNPLRVPCSPPNSGNPSRLRQNARRRGGQAGNGMAQKRTTGPAFPGSWCCPLALSDFPDELYPGTSVTFNGETLVRGHSRPRSAADHPAVRGGGSIRLDIPQHGRDDPGAHSPRSSTCRRRIEAPFHEAINRTLNAISTEAIRIARRAYVYVTQEGSSTSST